MGNTWTYELVLQETTQFTPELFRQVVDLADDYAYRLHYPIYATSDNGETYLEFSDTETLSTYLCSQGGNFPVWREDKDILLGFYPSNRRIDHGVQYDLHRDRDEQISSDLENLFLALCQKFQAHYGYSHDERHLEAIFPGYGFHEGWQKFESSVLKDEPPLLLFWLNYFERSYYVNIGEWRFEELQPSKLVTTQHGVFIYLASSPSNIRHAILGKDGKYHLIDSNDSSR
jgi:hypothetical protein